MNWPPAYTVKKHPRARHVKLKASLQHGLELVVPLNFNVKSIPDILGKNKTWIEKHLAQLQLHKPSAQLPDKIVLPLLGQEWTVRHVLSTSKLQMILRPHQEIVLLGNLDSPSSYQKILIPWVKNQAKAALSLQLNSLSEAFELPYEKVTIRDQKTRWGSCTRKKSISLNYKLLFLPPKLVDHILLHELCHTIHLNHSEKFWNLLAQFDPDWREHRRKIRRVNELIPDWIL